MTKWTKQTNKKTKKDDVSDNSGVKWEGHGGGVGCTHRYGVIRSVRRMALCLPVELS